MSNKQTAEQAAKSFANEIKRWGDYTAGRQDGRKEGHEALMRTKKNIKND